MNGSADPPEAARAALPLEARPQATGTRIPVLLVESGRTVGGTERVVSELARRLDRTRFAPWVVLEESSALDALAADIERAGVPVERLAEMSHRLQAGRALGTLAFLGRRGRTILHVHHVWPAADRYLVPLARVAGVRVVVVTEHLVGFSHSPLQRWLKRRELVTADQVVCVSQAVLDALGTDYGADAVQEARVIRNGVDAARLDRTGTRMQEDRARVRGEAGLDEAAFVWLFVGRLERQKGVDVLLGAAARAAQWAGAAGAGGPGPVRLWIVGDGKERAALETLARAHASPALEVRFLGAMADPLAWYAAADGFALASRWEGLPLSLLEAQAAGLPVVATRAGGVAEALADGVAGRLVPVEDEAAFAAAMRAVENDRALARRMGDAGARRAHEEWSWERMVGAYESVYERAWRRVSGSEPGEGSP
jgi:glycosyltransferase involved in cell wall biosynthesis